MIQSIHEKLSEYIEGQHIAGAGIRVRHGSEVLHEEYIGYADIANQIPVDRSTIFRLASMTKPVIAVAIMIMAEKGKLAIADGIEKYIPEFSQMRVAARQIAFDAGDIPLQLKTMEYEPLKRAITIEDLLRHRSGIAQGPISVMQGVFKTEPDMTLSDCVANIAKAPLDFQPGTRTGYSAVAAFDILGRILEIVSGMGLESLLNELLFKPLGMKDTSFTVDEAAKARVPRLYERKDGRLVDTAAPDEFSEFGFSFPCGSGGLYSTLDDYDRFVQMLAQKSACGETRLLSAETVAAMAATSPDDPALRMPAPSWGLGMCVFPGLEKSGRYLSPGTFGWSGAFGTHFYIDPISGVSMVLMVNRSDIGGADSYVSHGIEEVIYKSLKGLQ